MKLFFRASFLIGLLVLFSPIFAKAVSFEEYHKRIKTKLPEWEKASIDVKRAQETLQGSQAYLYPHINATANASSGSGSSSGTLSIDQQSGVIANLGISQTLPFGVRLKGTLDYSHITMEGTNTTMSGLNMSDGSFNYTSSVFNQTTDSPTLGLQATVPLLKNLFGILDGFSYKDAVIQKASTELNVKLTHRNLFTSYAKIYYQWIYLNRMHTYLEQSLSNSMLQEKQMAQKLKDGLADQDFYEASRIQRLVIEEQIRQTANNIHKLGEMLSSVINLSNEQPDPTVWQTTLTEYLTNQLSPIRFESGDSAKLLELSLKRLNLSLSLLRNQSLPNLNLIGQVSVKSGSTTNGIGEAFANLNQTEGYVGIQFDYPIGSGVSKTKDTELAIRQLKLQQSKQKQDYTRNLRILTENIKFYRDLIRIKRQNLKYTQSKFKEQQKKYNQGRLSLSDLIITESALISTQVSLTANEYNLIAAELDYRNLIGK